MAPPVAELLQRQSIHPAPMCTPPCLSLGQCVQPAPQGEASTRRHASRTCATTASLAGQSAAVAYNTAAGGGLPPAVFPTAARRRCAVSTRPPALASRGGPRLDERVAGARAPLVVGRGPGAGTTARDGTTPCVAWARAARRRALGRSCPMGRGGRGGVWWRCVGKPGATAHADAPRRRGPQASQCGASTQGHTGRGEGPNGRPIQPRLQRLPTRPSRWRPMRGRPILWQPARRR